MKSKFYILSTIISSCILSFACNQATATELNSKTLAYCQQQGDYYNQQQGSYYGSQQPGAYYGSQQQGGYYGGQQRGGYQVSPYAPRPGGAVTNPNMPTAPNRRRPCYPASRCTGDPNLMGGGTSAPTGKVLQVESVEKYMGTVQSINRISMPNQTQIQMILSTDQGDVLVILGPANFIDQQKIKFQAGDKVTVLGYRVRANGSDVITAAQVQKNGNTLQLLDGKRQPVWGNNP